MRIISKFHDYYDRAMAHGQDQTVVYNRAVEYPELKPPFKVHNHRLIRDITNVKHDLCFQGVTVLFCGTLYRGITVLDRKHPDYYKLSAAGALGETFYDPLALLQHLQGLGFESSDLFHSLWFNRRKQPLLPVDVTEFYDDNRTDRHKQWMIDHKLTILVVSACEHSGDRLMRTTDQVLAKDVRLADYQFFRVKDAFAAFQELDMWVSGVLPSSCQPPIEIQDKFKIAEHGFDEWSFRKQSQPKRRK